MQDNDVIIKIKNNNTELFREIVKKYYQEIYYYVKKQLFNHDDALDLTQEIFVKIYQNIKLFDPNKASFRTWIYKIAANYCLDFMKSKAYKNLQITFLLESDIVFNRNMVDAMVKEETIKQIIQLMNTKFKKQHRLIMQLYYFAELEVNEIAKVLNISNKTIYSTLHSSVNKIKCELEVNDE